MISLWSNNLSRGYAAMQETLDIAQINTQPLASVSYTLTKHGEFLLKLDDGKITIKELRSTFESLVSNESFIKVELKDLSINELQRKTGTTDRDLNKDELIEQAYHMMLSHFVPGIMFCYSFGSNFEKLIRQMITGLTDSHLQEYASECKRYFHVISSNPDKKINTKVKLDPAKNIQCNETFQVVRKYHSYRQRYVFIVTGKIINNLEKALFRKLCNKAQQFGGNYSSAIKDTPAGFMFNTEQNASKFFSLLSKQSDALSKQSAQVNTICLTSLNTEADL